MRILCVVLCLSLMGCATPGLKATVEGDSIKMEPIKKTGVFAPVTNFFFPPKMPKKAKAVIGDKSLEYDSKMDFTIVDLNMVKGK